MSFNKKLKLLKVEPATGRKEPEVVDSAEVWAYVSDVGTVTKLEAMAVGINAELSAVMWRNEFHGYTHAEYEGTRYRIVQTGSAENSLHIKLTLERG